MPLPQHELKKGLAAYRIPPVDGPNHANSNGHSTRCRGNRRLAQWQSRHNRCAARRGGRSHWPDPNGPQHSWYPIIFLDLVWTLLVAQLAKAFLSSDEEFNKTYCFPKPPKSMAVVFSCRSGVRARSAAETVSALGYTTSYFPGSWEQWAAAKQGKR